MTDAKTNAPKLIIKKPNPTIYISRNKKFTVMPGKPLELTQKWLNSPYKEEIIFSTTNNSDEVQKGEFRSLVLKNQLYNLTNNSRTVASYVTHDNRRIEKTSEKVTKLIGKKNYDKVFVALCSVISQELKIQAILALLTEDTPDENEGKHKALEQRKLFKDSACQTNEISKDIFYKKKVRPKRRVTSLIVSDVKRPSPNRMVIDPSNRQHQKQLGLHAQKDITKTQSLPEIPDLHLDEDSNGSVMSTSQLSVCSDILNSEVRKLMSVTENSIKKEVQDKPEYDIIKLPKTEAEAFGENFYPSVIVTLDGSKITVPVKPEDQFHLATPEILKHITTEERKKLLWHQAYIDWKLCLEQDEDGNMPLHLAVLHNDVDLIRRQCLVLRARGQSVDVLANGMTALEMSIKNNAAPACTRTLLECGASPLRCDREERSALHQTAEGRPAHLREVLAVLKNKAREIVEDSEELQYPGLMGKSDAEIAEHLLLHTSIQYDSEGYTPLLLAAKAGDAEATSLLAAATPQTVNTPMPNTGNTALFVAISEAYTDGIERGNRDRIADNYQKTIETLLDHGADPEIENRAGLKVLDLLQEFNITSLSLLVAQKVTTRMFGGDKPNSSSSQNSNNFILLKDTEGQVRLLSDTDRKLVQSNKPSPKLEGKGQGDVKRGKKINKSVPTNSLASNLDSKMAVQGKPTLMPKAKSFIETATLKTYAPPKKVKIVGPEYLVQSSKIVRARSPNKTANSPQKLNSKCIIIKDEKLTDAALVLPHNGTPDVSLTNRKPPQLVSLTLQDNLTERNARLLELKRPNILRLSSPTAKRSRSPENCSLPELSNTEKCPKRKSRVFSGEKDRGDNKKLKSPEG